MSDLDRIFNFQDNEIHIWMAFSEELADCGLLSCYWDMLSVQERSQFQRFYFARDSHQYLISRALLRSILSGYTGVLPQYLEFPRNDYGRPELKASSERISCLNFNLSHTNGLVLCAVAPVTDIGADVECNSRKTNYSGIFSRFFSQQEQNDLQQMQEDKRRYRFFEYWTLKESYIKALGKGLSIPLNRFGFSISEGPAKQIFFHTQVGDDDKQWQFFLFNPSEQYTAAISVSRETSQEYRLNIRKIIPLHSMYTCSNPYISSGSMQV